MATRPLAVRPKPTTPCVLHAGSLDRYGYGKAMLRGVHMTAHRRAWILLHGDPGSLEVDHLCQVRACVRLDHLQAISQIENIHLGRSETCVRGHPFTKENTRWESRGGRWPKPRRKCIECERARKRRAWARRATP